VIVPGTAPEPKKMPTKEKKTEVDAPATIVVTLPTEAKLLVDGNATTSTSGRRVLQTPVLANGSDYVYTLRAEVVRNGQTMVETQEVTVRAGEISEVPFNFASQGVASR